MINLSIPSTLCLTKNDRYNLKKTEPIFLIFVTEYPDNPGF